MFGNYVNTKNLKYAYVTLIILIAFICKIRLDIVNVEVFDYALSVLFSFVPFMIDYQEVNRSFKWWYSVVLLDFLFFVIMLRFDDLHYAFINVFGGEGYGPYVTLVFLFVILANLAVIIKAILGEEKGIIPFIVTCICSYSVIVLQANRINLCLVTQLGVMNIANALSMKITLITMSISVFAILILKKVLIRK